MDKPGTDGPRVFTIGHSNHSIEHFVGLLNAQAVQVAVDVRSQPYSKYARQFDSEPLKAALRGAGISYLYLGRGLGGRPEGEQFYDREGHVYYDRVAATPSFQEALSRLEQGIKDHTVAIVCAEENPAECHRRLLVGRVLLDHGIRVEHLRGDGRIQTEAELASATDPDPGQFALFQKTEVEPWKSIPSVSRKKRPNNSSAY